MGASIDVTYTQMEGGENDKAKAKKTTKETC